MTLRVIVQSISAEAAANVGGQVWSEMKTFDIEAPKLEMFLRAHIPALAHREVVGIEVLKEGV